MSRTYRKHLHQVKLPLVETKRFKIREALRRQKESEAPMFPEPQQLEPSRSLFV